MILQTFSSAKSQFLFSNITSKTISRVMSRIIIYPVLLSPAGSSDLPENVTGSHMVFYSVLLRMGFTCALSVTRKAVVSYTALPPLPEFIPAVHFCCTVLGVTSTRRYLASCPVKPGLSSPDPFRFCQPRLFILLVTHGIFYHRNNKNANCFYTSKQPLPTNSLKIELLGIVSLGTPRK